MITTTDGDSFDYYLDKDGDIILLVPASPCLLYTENAIKIIEMLQQAIKNSNSRKQKLK